jgi:predicted phage-related endonuclease
VLIGGNTFKWKFVERDEEIISMLVQLESEFWQHVQDFIPPPLDGSEASVKFISEKFPRSIRTKINLPDNASALIDKYESACEMVEQYTVQKQEAENLLKQMLGENEAGVVGEHVVTWKSVIQERLDSKTLKSERPSLFKKYANKITHRRFSIKTAS